MFGRASVRGRGSLAVGVVVVGVAIAAIVVATRPRSEKRHQSENALPVYVALAHSTVHAGSLEAIEAINKSNYQVAITACGPHVSPRTSMGFSAPTGPECADATPVAPHSVLHYRPPRYSYFPTPGKYWVWLVYVRYAGRVEYTAYTKVTVLAP